MLSHLGEPGLESRDCRLHERRIGFELREHLLERLASATESAANRAVREIDDLGDLSRGAALPVEQLEHDL